MKEIVKIELMTFYSPEYIYLAYDKKETLKIKRSKIVDYGLYMGESYKKRLYSPVSGKIIGLKEIEIFNGRTRALVIENDFRDFTDKINGYKRNVNNLTKTETNDLLDKYNIENRIGGKETLYVNIEYNKKTSISDSIVVAQNYYEILSTIDDLLMIYEIPFAYIIVDSTDEYTNYYLNRHINSYVNINIINKVNNKIEESVTFTVEEILKVRKALYFDKYISTSFLTLVNRKDSLRVVEYKDGSSLYELLYNLKIPFIDSDIFINSTYKINNIKDFILTKDVKTVTII